MSTNNVGHGLELVFPFNKKQIVVVFLSTSVERLKFPENKISKNNFDIKRWEAESSWLPLLLMYAKRKFPAKDISGTHTHSSRGLVNDAKATQLQSCFCRYKSAWSLGHREALVGARNCFSWALCVVGSILLCENRAAVCKWLFYRSWYFSNSCSTL